MSKYMIAPRGTIYSREELYHAGVKGMKWGVRKKTPAANSGRKSGHNKQTDEDLQKARRDKIKKAAKIGAAVAGTALAAYGAYKVTQLVKNKNVQLATQKGERLAKEYMSKNKITLKSGSFAGHISTYAGGKFVERTSRPQRQSELRSMARTAYDTNRQFREIARGIRSDEIRKAERAGLGTAVKNVASYYWNKRKR